jgi:transposase-like protein
MEGAASVSELAKELGVPRQSLYRWRDQQLGNEKGVGAPGSREESLEHEVQVLKQSLANRALEVDFFKGALQKVAARRQRSGNSGEKAFTTRSGK